MLHIAVASMPVKIVEYHILEKLIVALCELE